MKTCCFGPDGVAPFETLFGVKPIFAMQLSALVPQEEVLARARPFELVMALINRSEPLVSRTVGEECRCQISETVLLIRGKQPEGSKLQPVCDMALSR